MTISACKAYHSVRKAAKEIPERIPSCAREASLTSISARNSRSLTKPVET